MKSHTSLVAQQTRLSEWAEMVRDCQNRPQGMKMDEWCRLHDITKASYYWRLRKVREAFLEVVYITDKLTIPHGQSDHLPRRFRSLISKRDSRRSKSFL